MGALITISNFWNSEEERHVELDLDFGYLRKEIPKVLYPRGGNFFRQWSKNGYKHEDGPFVGQGISAMMTISGSASCVYQGHPS